VTRWLGVALLASGLSASAATGPAAAQRTAAAAPDTVTLDRVEDLVQAGRTEDARAVLLTWWSRVLPKASRRDVQRGLWLRARLTVDPSQAALDYQRLVVEYPGGPYSAQALFRLAQAAWESGDSAGAARDVAHLARDYPGSRVRGDADAWLAAAGPPPPPPAVTTKDSAVAEAPPAQVGGRYAVQLGAFSSEARARSMQHRAEGAGFEARVVRVPGSRLLHVRVGRYDSSSAAADVSKRLEGLGFTAALVTDADREEPIRD
jgi:cell division septation protein DedD